MAVKPRQQKRKDLASQDVKVNKKTKSQSAKAGTPKVIVNKKKKTGGTELEIQSVSRQQKRKDLATQDAKVDMRTKYQSAKAGTSEVTVNKKKETGGNEIEVQPVPKQQKIKDLATQDAKGDMRTKSQSDKTGTPEVIVNKKNEIGGNKIEVQSIPRQQKRKDLATQGAKVDMRTKSQSAKAESPEVIANEKKETGGNEIEVQPVPRQQKRNDLATKDVKVDMTKSQSDKAEIPEVIVNKKEETGGKELKVQPDQGLAILSTPRRSRKRASTTEVAVDSSSGITTRSQLKRKAEDEGHEAKKKVRVENQKEEIPKGKSEYQRIVELANVVVTNFDPFECSICYSFIDVDAGVILQDCLHSFCRPCLASTVEHSETVMVRCPFVDEAYACESHLRELEIRNIVTPEILERHHQRSIILAEGSAENSFHCKTANCRGWCVYDQGVQSFPCNVCGRTNCLSCAVIHEGRTCRQYKDKANFRLSKDKQELKTKEYIEDMIKKGKVMPCPNCKVIVKKQGGCDHMHCTMCRRHFNWAPTRIVPTYFKL